MNHQPSHAAIDIRDCGTDECKDCSSCPLRRVHAQRPELPQLATWPVYLGLILFYSLISGIVLALLFSSSCRIAHAQELSQPQEPTAKVGDRFRVTKKFLVAMKATAIEECAVAIRRGDKRKLEELVSEERLGGVAAGVDLKILFKATGENASIPAWCADASFAGTPMGKVYVFEPFLGTNYVKRN